MWDVLDYSLHSVSFMSSLPLVVRFEPVTSALSSAGGGLNQMS